jgi:hypothetical protein
MKSKELIELFKIKDPSGELEVEFCYDSISEKITKVTVCDEYDWLPALDPENHVNGKSLQKTGKQKIYIE